MEMKCFSMILQEKYFESIVFYNVFRTQFPTCGKLSFPIGKVNKVDDRNYVLECFCFPMFPGCFLGRITEKHFISIVFYNVFSTRFPTPQNPMETNGFCMWQGGPGAEGTRRGGPCAEARFWELLSGGKIKSFFCTYKKNRLIWGNGMEYKGMRE